MAASLSTSFYLADIIRPSLALRSGQEIAMSGIFGRKRPREDLSDAATGTVVSDALIALNREISTAQFWGSLRQTFFFKFSDCFENGKSTTLGGVEIPAYNASIREPMKFKRHCREALAKWVLSQKAREPTISEGGQDPATRYFLPSNDSTFDDQLIRDLTLKCKTDPATFPNINARDASIQEFVKRFDLGTQCKQAHARIEAELAAMKSGSVKPMATGVHVEVVSEKPGASDPATAGAQRIEGDVLSIKVNLRRGLQLPNWFSRSLEGLNVPMPAWRKMKASYSAVCAASTADAQGDIMSLEDFTLRAATLVLRYELNLSSGSLQLCADESLKELFEEKGFRVADLCASPINAFVSKSNIKATPTTTATGSNELAWPPVFCSAFFDTDRFFGSIGSALQLDMKWFAETHCRDGKTWLLTLDVPYDEDLCELLFLKLHGDIEKLESGSCGGEDGKLGVRFMGVLPLWWDLRFTKCPKQCISPGKSNAGEVNDEDKAKMQKLIDEGVSYLKAGHVIDYAWMATLGPSPWACFDAVFVKDEYTYYCSSTNRQLPGVTATEVIGFESPSITAAAGRGDGDKQQEASNNPRGVRVEALLRTYYSA